MSSLNGNAGEIPAADAAAALGPVLMPNEPGNPLPIRREFNSKVDVWEAQSVLAQMVLR